MGLSATIDTAHAAGCEGSDAQLCLHVNHALILGDDTPYAHVDVVRPASVTCIDLERLNLLFDFRTSVQERRLSVEASVSDNVDVDEMLLDALNREEAPSETFEDTVQRISRGLPLSIRRCFDPPASVSNDSEHLQITASIQHSAAANETGFKPADKASDQMKVTDLAAEQLQASFSNRHRISSAAKSKAERRDKRAVIAAPASSEGDRDVMLLDDAELQSYLTDADDSEVMFSQTPSLTSNSSTTSTMFKWDNLDHTPDTEFTSTPMYNPVLPIATIDDLFKTSLYLLVSGSQLKKTAHVRRVQIERSPDISLSDLVPSLFSPGFTQVSENFGLLWLYSGLTVKSVSHNACFLPRISYSISLSFARNMQSPALKKKLSQLANSSTLFFADNDEEKYGSDGSSQRALAAVEARLWAMIHRCVYNPAAAQKIPALATDLEEEDEDLLEGAERPRAAVGHDADFEDANSAFEDLLEDEWDEWNDLLAGEDDEILLGNDEERERLAVEQETDEMLFGGCDEDEAILSDNESMLL